jgi:hypothetical protein
MQEAVFDTLNPTPAFMKLAEEIILYQFAQGVHPVADLVKRFSQLDEGEKMRHFLELNSIIRKLKSTEDDFQQALSDNSLAEGDLPAVFFKDNRLKVGVYNMSNLQEGDYEKAYTFLLYLLKTAYQRQAALKDPTDWRYWDLSNPEVVQNIQTRHQEAVEAVYANPSYRSEFASIAKLWHERYESRKPKSQEPVPERQTHFTYMSYEEMISESINVFNDKQTFGIDVLRHSLEKALAKQYLVNKEEANRVIWEVIERHLRETYNTDLF